MPYLNLDPNYFEHHKTKRLVTILGPMSDVLPLRLWAYCAKFHPVDGRMRGYDAREVEALIGWTGKPKAAITALAKVGYILATPRGFACVDWRQHEGHLEAFSRRAKAGAKARWAKYKSANASSNASSINSNAPAVPYRTIPDQQRITAANGAPSAADLSKLADQKHVKHVLKKSGDELMHRQLPFSFGDIPKGRRIIDIDAASAQAIIDRMPTLGLELRIALQARINLKKSESL